MDATDRKIVGLLAADSRRSLADIGAIVGLAPSSVNERIRRLGESGAIRRFTVEVDPRALGFDVTAFVWVELTPGSGENDFRRFAAAYPAIAECHHVTGAWSYLLKVQVESVSAIEGFLAELKRQGWLARSETMIALSTIVETAVPKLPEEEG